MRESTLTWSEAQRQVEIDRREIGEKCPREDRLERLDILNQVDVQGIQDGLSEYFGTDEKDEEKLEKEDEEEKKRLISEEEEADRKLAEKEQAKLRKEQILQNSPCENGKNI